MTLDTRPLHPLFGAEVCGVDPQSEDPGLTAALDRAMGRFGLLLLRGVAADDAALTRIAARFGRLQNMSGSADVVQPLVRVSNLAEDGTIKPADDAQRLRHEANLMWHTDSSFLSPGATYSFLHARIVTQEGGRTEFCDTRAAWDSLSHDRQQALLPLEADHSMLHSWRLSGVEVDAVAPMAMPSVRRKLAPLHAPSGRRALMVPSHVERIVGLDATQCRALLDELQRVATRPDRVYAHIWQPGDLLVWDNRCMLHRVTPYAAMDERRDLRSCRVIDGADDSHVVASGALHAA